MDWDWDYAIIGSGFGGSVSGFDFENLHRQLGRECAVIETEWLPQLR